MNRRAFWIALIPAFLVACAALSSRANGDYRASVAAGLEPHLSPDDAVAISFAYLAEQTPEIAAPELHVGPHISQVWAVLATDARALDGCVPARASTAIVWVTKGVGDYLNLHDLPWSRGTEPTDDPLVIACEGPGPAGTLVIDDATGSVLGVYPFVGDQYPHPS